MRIGISLPVRELKDELGAIRDFVGQAPKHGFVAIEAIGESGEER